jgi:apoptosis-inducing factor 3
MSEGPSQPRGPDLSQGVPLKNLVDGEMLLEHVEGEPAVLVRRGADLFAVGATWCARSTKRTG